jgi:hypothetical protein
MLSAWISNKKTLPACAKTVELDKVLYAKEVLYATCKPNSRDRQGIEHNGPRVVHALK